MNRDDRVAVHRLSLVPSLRPKMIMIPAAGYRQLGGTVALGVTLLAFVSGCASHGPAWSARFVKPGEPTATFDDPASAPAAPKPPKPESLSDYARKLRTIQANARTTISMGNTIGENPDNWSSLLTTVVCCPRTIVASTVAT